MRKPTEAEPRWTTVTYEIDAENHIRAVSTAWSHFAADNEAPDLTREEDILGRSLWSYIASEETRRLYGLIFYRVRHTHQPAAVPFRCDSPTERRFMELTIQPEAEGRLRLTGVLLRREPREYTPLLDPHAARSDETVEICGRCKRVKTDRAWLEVEEAVRELGIFGSAKLPMLSHGECDDCARPWLAELDG